MLDYERRWWATGCKLIAGVDEAGRGPLAGSVVAASVSVDSQTCERLLKSAWSTLNDSKCLSDKVRRVFFLSINELPEAHVGVGICTPSEIDEFNILRATHIAMVRAIDAMPQTPSMVLVDGLPVKGLPVESEAIVGGDGKSLLIAAASVIAKVTRDDMMLVLDEEYPEYGFAKHKGYGTKQHMEALREHGPCPAHRRSYEPVRQAEMKLER